MNFKGVLLSEEDMTDLDIVKKKIKAKSRPETIRFLMRLFSEK